MIVLWGLESDQPLAMVGAALGARGTPLFFLDQAAVCATRLAAVGAGADGADAADGADGAGQLEVDGARLDLASVDGIYLRPFDTRRLPAVERLPEADPQRHAALCTDDALLGWCDSSPAQVLNRPSAMASNNSKPYQAALIRRAGFDIPDTLVTNELDALHGFLQRHPRVIYKSTSGVRSIVSSLGDDLPARAGSLAACPTQFQEFVSGVDYRVHVVGDRVFATEIRSDAEDYRYAARQGKSLSLRETVLPIEVAERAVRLTRQLGLVLGGVDLRHCPDGRWICFEVNPSPGFTFYENATGQPIAAAIADLLARPQCDRIAA